MAEPSKSEPHTISSRRPLKRGPDNPRSRPLWRIPAGIRDAPDSAVHAAVEACEALEKYCGGLVILGLALEFGLALANSGQGSVLERWGAVIVDAMVALGVGGEILFAGRVSTCQNELTRRSNDRLSTALDQAASAEDRGIKALLQAEAAQAAVADAQSELADALCRLSEAEASAGELRAQAAENEMAAAQARLELERLKAPRELKPEQRAELVKAMSSHSKVSFYMSVSPYDPEAWMLVETIEQALSSAGLAQITAVQHGNFVHERPLGFSVGVVTRIGVGVAYGRSLPAAKAAGDHLAKALNEAGIAAMAGFGAEPSDTIHVMVGRKPL